MGTAIKHPVPDRVKPSFVIFDIRALWRSERQSARMSKMGIRLKGIRLVSCTVVPYKHNRQMNHVEHNWVHAGEWPKFVLNAFITTLIRIGVM